MKTAQVKIQKPTIFRYALFWQLRLALAVVALDGFPFFSIAATELRIKNFSPTNLTWSCSSPFPFYHVEWAPYLSGPWQPFVETDATNSPLNLTNVSKPAMFLRVVATTNSLFFKGVAVAWTGNTNAGFRVAYTNGDSFVALTEANASGNVTHVTGAVWQPAGHPPSIFYASTNGLPERAVIEDHVFLFGNYSSNKVDVAMIDLNNSITVMRDLAFLNNLAQLPVIVQGTTALTEAKALEASSLLLSVGGCVTDVFKSIATGGIYVPKAFIGCGNAALDGWLFATGDDNPALIATSAALSGIDCDLALWTAWTDGGLDAALSCGGAALSVAAAVKEEAAMQMLSKVTFIQTAQSQLAAPPLTFLTQPTTQTINSGATATFSATVQGGGTLAWQWFKGTNALSDGGGYSGTHSATLTISGANTGHVGAYSVKVSSLGWSATSVSANLRIRVQVANSSADFSGTQGYKGWYYGYAGGPGGFSSLPQYKNGTWTFVCTNFPTDAPYWTMINPVQAHPNGLCCGKTSQVMWAVRKWVASATGTYEISCSVVARGGVEAVLSGGGSSHTFDFASGSSQSFVLLTQLSSSDSVLLSVGPNGDDVGDTTDTGLLIYRIYQ